MAPRSQEVTPAGFWSLNADLLALVETFVEPAALPALALAEQRCRAAARPRLQGLAALRLPPFGLSGKQILGTEYDIYCKGLGAAGAQALAAIIAGGHMAHVKVLDLAGNSLRDPGVQALAPALRHLPRLEELCLNANRIGEAGAAALARAATDGALPRLQSLDLDRNRIGDGGVRALAAAVAGGALARLEELDLDDNEIGDAGAEALAAACANAATLPRLTTLELAFNQIGDGGMRALAAAIAGGGLAALRAVRLAGNRGRGDPVRAALHRRESQDGQA